MQLKCKDFEKKLPEITSTEEFVLKDVSPIYACESGKRTDTLLGFRYTVADPATFDSFNVKVASGKPLITVDALADSGVLFVTFVNAVVKPYRIEFGNVLFTVTADSIKLADN